MNGFVKNLIPILVGGVVFALILILYPGRWDQIGPFATVVGILAGIVVFFLSREFLKDKEIKTNKFFRQLIAFWAMPWAWWMLHRPDGCWIRGLLWLVSIFFVFPAILFASFAIAYGILERMPNEAKPAKKDEREKAEEEKHIPEVAPTKPETDQSSATHPPTPVPTKPQQRRQSSDQQPPWLADPNYNWQALSPDYQEPTEEPEEEEVEEDTFWDGEDENFPPLPPGWEQEPPITDEDTPIRKPDDNG